ncbi:MAG: YicC family protein [Desulfobacterota bacterium]|nr:YicC family protein [Thermodesulfobacteriota bacterium]
MLRSMTGYGKGEGETTLGRLTVEVRSVNHRYSDINLKLPKRLSVFEPRIRELIRSRASRGRIDLSVKLEATADEKIRLQIDTELADQYVRALLELKERFHLQGEITLELLAGAKDVIVAKEESGEVEPYWREMLPILQRSLDGLDEMRRAEGEALARDLRIRLSQIQHHLEAIETRLPSHLEAYQERFRERLKGLLQGVEVDPLRFQQEIALLTERLDVTEEIVRTKSHLQQLASLFEEREAVGRKMDFLLQEIHREVNTISSKASDAYMSQRVVEIKSELEKIREQVQNVE